MSENQSFAACSVAPHSGELNEHSFLKPAGYHELLCAVAEAVNTHTGQSLCDTLSRGFAWAFASLTMDVKRPIQSCAPLSARTWLSPARFPFFRREIALYDDCGQLSVGGTIFFIALSLIDHRIIYDRARLNYSPEIIPDMLIPDAQSRMSEPKGFAYAQTFNVRPSDIDALGHMNNCRYAACIYDAVSPQQRSLFEHPFRYSIDFRRQLEPDSSVEIELLCGDPLYVRGVRTDDRKVSFQCSVSPSAKN